MAPNPVKSANCLVMFGAIDPPCTRILPWGEWAERTVRLMSPDLRRACRYRRIGRCLAKSTLCKADVYRFLKHCNFFAIGSFLIFLDVLNRSLHQVFTSRTSCAITADCSRLWDSNRLLWYLGLIEIAIVAFWRIFVFLSEFQDWQEDPKITKIR